MKKRNYKEITSNLNKARLQAGNREFRTVKEFQEYLESFDIKLKSPGLASRLKKLLVENRFPEYPIYIDKVISIYDDLFKPEPTDPVQAAIKLLKQHGYKVLAPVTQYKEI